MWISIEDLVEKINNNNSFRIKRDEINYYYYNCLFHCLKHLLSFYCNLFRHDNKRESLSKRKNTYHFLLWGCLFIHTYCFTN